MQVHQMLDRHLIIIYNNVMERMIFNLTTAEARWLREESKRMEVSMSEVMRRILSALIEKECHGSPQ